MQLRMIKEKYKKFIRALVLLLILIAWIFSGWPRIFNVPPKIEMGQAQVTPPTFVACGTMSASTGNAAPELPAGWLPNDIFLLFVESANEPNIPPTGGWTAVANSPQGTGATGGTSATALEVFWKRADASEFPPAVGARGDHTIATVCAFRGVITTENPWDVTNGGVEASDTTLSATGNTTTIADTLIVIATTNHIRGNTTSRYSNWTNTDLASVPDERFDRGSNVGNGGGIGIATGEKASTGTYGATTATLSASGVKAFMTIALKPEPPPSNNPPETPTLSETPAETFAFPNKETSDTTPVLGNFSATDPNGDAVEYQVQIDDNADFGSPIVLTDDGLTSSTFYTMQDALANGQTYWWRVRARDPAGSNTWSGYSEKLSISINTSLTIDRWMQTTGDQFNTDALSSDLEITAGNDGVKIKGW